MDAIIPRTTLITVFLGHFSATFPQYLLTSATSPAIFTVFTCNLFPRGFNHFPASFCRTDYYRTFPLFLKCQELQFHRTAQSLVDGLKFELLFGLVYGRPDMKTATLYIKTLKLTIPSGLCYNRFEVDLKKNRFQCPLMFLVRSHSHNVNAINLQLSHQYS